MSFKASTVNWNSLIQFTKEGIIVANYQEVRSAITARFKEIYGSDIDLATTSADGVYVETLCLMINNVLQSFKQFYSQLDVKSASGRYLETLCALSNIYRQPESYSTAVVNLTLQDEDTYSTKEIQLVDKNGNIWTYSSDTEIVFTKDETKELVFTCEISGPVRANAGWINSLVNNDVVFKIEQTSDAILGSYEESDSELRARRNDSLGSTGKTVLESLVGTLYQYNAIDDVKIYNNNTTSSITSLDGNTIPMHSVYIILRRVQNIDLSDETIASKIYEKMTPGICTAIASSNYGTAKEVEYTSDISGISSEVFVKQYVRWKEATPIHPEMKITIKKTANYGGDSTAKTIALNVIEELNKKRLSSRVYIEDLWNVVFYSDPGYRNTSTYYVVSIAFADKDKYDATPVSEKADNLFTLPDTYFEYSINDIKIEYDGDNVLIYLGGE